jgi:hypothetical protein
MTMREYLITPPTQSTDPKGWLARVKEWAHLEATFNPMTPEELQETADRLKSWRPDPDYLRHLLAQPDCPENLRAMAEHYRKLDADNSRLAD